MTWAICDSHNGAPISCEMVLANSSDLFSYSVIIFSKRVILSSLEEKPKVLNASLAAATAASISSLVPAEIEPITDSSEGFITSIVSEPSESTHSPFM